MSLLKRRNLSLLLCISSVLQQRVLVVNTFSTDSYLTHYWPITSGTMHDVVGNAHMTQGTTPTQYTSDRFGSANEALDLNGGYTQVPSDVYFATAFTITAWVSPDNVGVWARLVDFGFADQTSSIIVTLANAAIPNVPCFYMANPNQWTLSLSSSVTNSQ